MPSPARGDEEKPYKHDESADYSITWVGSAFKQGDAFTVTANIFKDKADIHWKGYKDNRFNFMSEKKKEMFSKSLTLTDNKSVGALRLIARRAELCDDGPPHALGQGVCTDVSVYEKGMGKNSMDYFATLESEHRAKLMEDIPRKVKAAVGDGKARPNLSPLRTAITRLSQSISSYENVLGKLKDGYAANTPLPKSALSGVISPPPLGTSSTDYPSPKHRAVISAETQKILNTILSDGSWKALTGFKENPQGLIFKVTRIEYSNHNSMTLPFAINLEKNHMPGALLSEEGERILLEFIMGGYYTPTHDRVIDACKLGFDSAGRLVVNKNENGMNFHPKTDYSFLKNERVIKHLEYLNQNGIVDILLPTRDKTNTHPPRILEMRCITVSMDKQPLAKVEFYRGNDLLILAMHKVKDKWVCGGVWESDDYYEKSSPFGNEFFRRPDEAPPVKKQEE